ncbi:MAG: hypothetical protein Q9169_004133 [Polycauliona sp. 2 TL-2023]
MKHQPRTVPCAVSRPRTWTTDGDGQGDGQRSGGNFVPQKQGATTTGAISGDSTQNDEPPPTEEEETPSETTPDESTSSTPANGETTSTDDNAMLAVINKWRTAYDIGTLTWSTAMVAGAAKTGKDNMAYFDGAKFVHGGSGSAEVMTPGGDSAGGEDLQGFSPFEVAYVSWLCEVNEEPVSSACAKASQVSPMNYEDENGNRKTGHQEILVDDKYKQIGCAFTKDPNPDEGSFFTGLWICNLS